MNPRALAALLAVLLLGTALRFYHVGEIPLRADEATNLYLAVEPPDTIVRSLVTSDPHLPLYYLLLHYWLILAGRSELALRYPTLWAAVLVVALVYALGRRAFPQQPKIALYAALLAVINPYLIWDAQDAYMYSMLTVTGVASFIPFQEVMRRRASPVTWAAYVVVSAVGLYLHYLAAMILIAQGVLCLWWMATNVITRRAALAWCGALLAIAVLFAPWLALALPLLTGFTSSFWLPVSLFEMSTRAFVAFSVGRMDSRLMTPMVDPLSGTVLTLGFLVLVLLGSLVPLRGRRDRASDADGHRVLAVYLCVPIAAYFVFTLVRFPVFDERYVLFLIPPFLLLLARGLVVLEERTGRLGVPAVALLFVVLASGRSLLNYWHVPAFAKSPDWHASVQQVLDSYQPGDVLIQNYPDPALPYYLRERVPRVLLPHTSPAQMSDVAADMERLTTRYARIWFQPVPYGEWDTGGLVATWLDRHARQARAYEFRGLRLALYLPVAAAMRQARSSDAVFGERIRLLAFDTDAAENLAPGRSLHLVLYWQAQDRPERDATVFAHVYGPDGKLWSQKDNPPVHGTYPTSEWNAGEIIVDSYDLLMPPEVPPGTYALMVGMYDSRTQERWRSADSLGQSFPENRLPLLNFNVNR